MLSYLWLTKSYLITKAADRTHSLAYTLIYSLHVQIEKQTHKLLSRQVGIQSPGGCLLGRLLLKLQVHSMNSIQGRTGLRSWPVESWECHGRRRYSSHRVPWGPSSSPASTAASLCWRCTHDGHWYTYMYTCHVALDVINFAVRTKVYITRVVLSGMLDCKVKCNNLTLSWTRSKFDTT